MRKKSLLKSVLFFGVLAGSSIGYAQRYDRGMSCETNSRGLTFRAEGRDADTEAINSCVRARITSTSQCERNLRCSNDSNVRPDEDRFPGRNGSVSLDARFRNCQRNNLCSYDISWSGRARQSVAVTVEMPRDGAGEKLFSCSDRDGSQRADWIQPGKPYVFRAYAVRDCSSFRNIRNQPANAKIRVVHR